MAVCGSGGAAPAELSAAEAVGRELAARGAVVVCGGRGGVMESACRGAKSAGGTTLGILPGDDRSDANEFVDVAVATGLGEARNALVVRAADAVIAVGGEWGTLSEIALALRAGKRVVGLRTWELPSKGGRGVVAAASPVEAVELALGGQPSTPVNGV
ncbi:MAG: TIGR00725 family protein [Thermoleophilaceae bacterium]